MHYIKQSNVRKLEILYYLNLIHTISYHTKRIVYIKLNDSNNPNTPNDTQ